MTKKVIWCNSCLNMSTRPRIEFDKNGKCNACVWSEKKKTMDWSIREAELNKLLEKHKSPEGKFDCVVPVSGGKDGSYVAHQLKHKYGMNPLCITVRPALELRIGDENLKNFINSGYDHIHITPDVEVMRKLNLYGFKEKGFPYYGWLIAIITAPISMAAKLGINLIFYGEDGEVEYGGSSETNKTATYDFEYMKKIYFEGGYDKVLKLARKEGIKTTFFEFPDVNEVLKMEIAHWSYFEAWDSYRNYVVAKEKCGLMENKDTNAGTFTNFAQNDQALYSLHAYLMYLKFGFGRATQDAGIEIRRGAMDRDQALNLVKLYDNVYPEHYKELYLDYFDISNEGFEEILDKFVNKSLFKKIDGKWQPKFELDEEFSL